MLVTFVGFCCSKRARWQLPPWAAMHPSPSVGKGRYLLQQPRQVPPVAPCRPKTTTPCSQRAVPGSHGYSQMLEAPCPAVPPTNRYLQPPPAQVPAPLSGPCLCEPTHCIASRRIQMQPFIRASDRCRPLLRTDQLCHLPLLSFFSSFSFFYLF